jgi:hypothetical protein
MHYHTVKDKKLEEAKKYLLERFDSIEFFIEYENNIKKKIKIHDKNYEAHIIIDNDENVKLCDVVFVNIKKHNNINCIIL